MSQIIFSVRSVMSRIQLTLWSFCIFVVIGCGDEGDFTSTGEPDNDSGNPTENDSSSSADSESTEEEQTSAKPPEGQPAAKLEFVPPELTEEELRAGWISLFDGRTLFGWDIPEGTNWHVEDGCIVASEGEISLLQTPFSFSDFEFRCEFHMQEGGNSGVFVRSAEDVKSPVTDTYEVNICDDHESHNTASIVGRHVSENVPKVAGDWHSMQIVCSDSQVKVHLDGRLVTEFTDESENRRDSGRIGLQKNKGRIAFRNVFLRPVNTKEVFNGSDLSGFQVVPGGASEFTVTEGNIHADNGPGFLETEETWSDFILHVESRIQDEKAIADGRPANSGVFFRAKKGTEEGPSNGYEMQIQHDFREDDRTTPADFGSGGIYRREPARYVVADNNTWVVQTLIAQGNRFATFVNGYQVLDWTDEREPNENPRRGLRREAGHLSLQGHDPTTDIDFRAIRVSVLPSQP